MKHKDNSSQAKAGEPILDFISGKMDATTAKRVTKNIDCLQSLWQLAKMTGIVKKYSEIEKSSD